MGGLTLGAIGATIYDVARRIKNGAFKQLAQNILNELSIQTVMQATEPIKMTQPLQGKAIPLTEKLKEKII